MIRLATFCFLIFVVGLLCAQDNEDSMPFCNFISQMISDGLENPDELKGEHQTENVPGLGQIEWWDCTSGYADFESCDIAMKDSSMVVGMYIVSEAGEEKANKLYSKYKTELDSCLVGWVAKERIGKSTSFTHNEKEVRIILNNTNFPGVGYFLKLDLTFE